MLIISRLDKILKDKKISKKELFESIELTRQGFDYAIKNDSLRVKDLESIANFLNVPVSYFFGEEGGEPATTKKAISRNAENEMQTEINRLREENSRLKDQVIELLQKQLKQ